MNRKQIISIFEEVGQSFMPPVAVMAVAGLLLGIGSAFTNPITIESYGLSEFFYQDSLLFTLFLLIKSVGKVIFDNLPLIFAVGVAYGLAKEEKGSAAMAAVVAFFVMNISINVMLKYQGILTRTGLPAQDVLAGTVASSCGIMTLQTGVFGGVIVGLGIAYLNNKFYNINLPSMISFFGKSHFTPIISMLIYSVLGVILAFTWTTLQHGIYSLGSLVADAGYFGTFLFGLIKRTLIPLGLHHVFYMPFWQTAVGGVATIDGVVVQGGQNIFLAELASPNVSHISSEATRYFSGEFIFIMFGLPGGALAMYHAARNEKKKIVGGLLLSAAGVCVLTGTTQPIEFSFLFAAPLLFAVHVFLGALAYMLAHIADIGVGLTYSGGILDFIIFGILPGNEKTGWIKVIPLGILYFGLYYGIFRFLILKFNFKTPGRENDDEETKLYTKEDLKAK